MSKELENFARYTIEDFHEALALFEAKNERYVYAHISYEERYGVDYGEGATYIYSTSLRSYKRCESAIAYFRRIERKYHNTDNTLCEPIGAKAVIDTHQGKIIRFWAIGG